MNSCPGVNKEGGDSSQDHKKQKKVCLPAKVVYGIYHWGGGGALVRASLSACRLAASVVS